MRKKGVFLIILLALIVITLALTGCTTPKITVSFDSMGGSTVSPLRIASDTTELELPTPKRDGYVFECWCYDYACTERVDTTVIPTENVTFYAKWTIYQVAVTFVADGERQYRFVPYGSSLALSEMPDVPAKEGFVGRWNTGALTNITSPLTIYAEYSPDTYSVTYVVEGNEYFVKSGSPGDSVLTPDNPTISGAVFIGWYLDENLSTPSAPISTIATSDVTLYGKVIYTAGMANYFAYDVDGGYASITGLTSAGKAQNALVIPEQIGGYPVKTVGNGFFPVFDNPVLKTVYVPACVETISKYAFAFNANLSELVLNEGLETIEGFAFAGDSALSSVNIPASVKDIGEYAFAAITIGNEQSIELPGEVYTPGFRWIKTDSDLCSVTFAPDSELTTIGQYAFYNVSLLESLALPDSDDYVYSYATFADSSIATFYANSSVYSSNNGAIYSADGTILKGVAPKCAEITLPDTVATIAPRALYGSMVTSITIPSSVTRIGERAFEDSAVETVTFAGTSSLATIETKAFASSALRSITLPSSVTSIAEGTFAGTPLAYVNLAATQITNIATGLFENCSELMSVSLGRVSSIGNYAFYNCRKLSSVTFPQTGLTSIGDWAFADCLSLRTVTIPSVTHFGIFAFAGVSGKSTAVIEIPRTTISIGDFAFMNTSTTVFNPNTVSLEYMGVGAFKNCSSLARANVPQSSSITKLPDETFYGCSRLSNVTIYGNIRILGERAFYGCSDLGSVTFKTDASNNGVTEIQDSCFENCVKLNNGGGEARILPMTLTTLGSRAFYNCSALTDVTLPNGLSTVTTEAFAHCSSLVDIGYDTYCTTDTLEENCFAYCTSLVTVTLPKNLAARTSTTGAIKNPFFGCSSLTSFAVLAGSELTVDDGVVYIADGLYRKIYLYPTGKTGEFLVENDVVSIDDYAFFGTRITTLTFNSVPAQGGVEDITFVNIGSYSFAESFITSAILSKRVKTVGPYAFYNSRLSSVELDGTLVAPADPTYNILNSASNNIMQIAEYAFAGTTLADVTIPARTSTISSGAFANCYSLRSLNFINGAISDLAIGEGAFRNDVSLTTLSFPSQLSAIGDYAFADCNNVANIVFGATDGIEIGDYAFRNNQYLYSIVLPAKLTAMGEGLFFGCSRLTDVSLSDIEIEFGIPDYAFFGCYELKSLFLPANVISIGESAFERTFVEEIIFEGGTSNLVIGRNAFAGTSKLLSITFPDNLTSIEEYAFYEAAIESFEYGAASFDIGDFAFACSGLLTVELKADVHMTGSHIFAYTEYLEQVVSNCPSIGEYAFFDSGVSSVTFVDVDTIRTEAFTYAHNLRELSIQFDKPITIEDNAFSSSGLERISLRATVLNIGYAAFSHTDSLISVNIDADEYSLGEYAFCFSSISSFVASGNATDLGDGFAMVCTNLESIDVTSAGNKYYTLDGVVYETTVSGIKLLQYPAGKYGSILDLDASVTAIADFAFSGNECLDILTIRSDETIDIGDYAFFDTLETFTLYVAANKVEAYDVDVNVQPLAVAVGELVLTLIIGDRYSLTDYTGTSPDVEINGIISDGTREYNVEKIDKGAFLNNEVVTSVTIRNGIKEISDYAFYGCANLTSITFGNNVSVVGPHAFDGCSKLVSVALDNEITSIGEYAFANCSSLESIVLSNKLINLGNFAFANDSSLTSVTIPSLQTLGDGAFDNATAIVSLHLPGTVKSIGSYAFRDCYNLSGLYLDGSSVTRLKNANSLAGTYAGLKILVPDDLVKSYRSDSTWRKHSSQILSADKIDNNYLLTPLLDGTYRLDAYLGTDATITINAESTNISEIGEYCFGQFCTSVTLVGIKTVDNNAFLYAENLASVTLTGVENIGDKAFYGLLNLTSVDFGSALLSIGDYCFANCSSLTTLVFPQKLNHIGIFAFGGEQENMHLTSVTFNGIATTSLSIGAYAFANNVYLESLTFNCLVSSIGNYAFADCLSLSSIYLNSVGSTATVIAENDTGVFANCDRLSIFVPSAEIRRNYLQTWYNTFDKNRLLLSRYVAEDYYDNGDLIVQDGFVISPIGDSGTVASIVNYIGPETVVTFPSRITINNTTYQIERLGRDENNSSNNVNGKIIGDNVTKITIPSSVKSITGDAFRGARALAEVDCADGSLLTNIGSHAFADCVSLTSVSLPKSVVTIGSYAFAGCVSLNSFVVEEFFSSEIDKTSLTIGAHAFDNCTGLVTITMPKHLLSIETYAFNHTDNLQTIIFPADCTIATIGTYAFAYSGMTYISLPGAVSNVGDNAFAYCSSLRSVYLARNTANYSSLTATGENVFRGVTSAFVKVYVPDSNYTQYGNSAGWSTKTVVPNLSVGDYTYRRSATTVILTGYIGNAKSITIPASLTINSTVYRVTTISAYFGNETLEEIEFDEHCSITTLDSHAFAACTSLRRIHLSDSILSIGEYAFNNCSHLTDIVLSSNIEEIPAYAFAGCTSLREITIPASVASIGNAAFLNCSSLYRVVINFTTVRDLGLSALMGTSKSLVIITPENRQESFASQWTDYRDVIFDRKQLFGDFVVTDDGHGGYVLAQYSGRLDVDMTDETINGKQITSIRDNAVIYDVTVEI